MPRSANNASTNGYRDTGRFRCLWDELFSSELITVISDTRTTYRQAHQLGWELKIIRARLDTICKQFTSLFYTARECSSTDRRVNIKFVGFKPINYNFWVYLMYYILFCLLYQERCLQKRFKHSPNIYKSYNRNYSWWWSWRKEETNFRNKI